MQKAIERVECGNKEERRTRKATLGMMTLLERHFCETVAPQPEDRTPKVLSFSL